MCGQIATLVGRYYAMDRDKRWERTKRAYDCWFTAKVCDIRILSALSGESYERGLTDEFVEPIVIVDRNGEPVDTIKRR